MKATVNNLMNELDELSSYCIDRAMESSFGDGEEWEHPSDGQEEYQDKCAEITKLIGGDYGTNDASVYDGLISFLETAREAKLWQAYALWLEERLESAIGIEEGDYYHQFYDWYENHEKWDKENKL